MDITADIQVVILAGGFGTRISEESHLRPKPMIEIGGTPILVHLMRFYASFGFRSFVVCGGYKIDYIRDYFALHPHSDLTIEIVDTGLDSLTGQRVRRIEPFIRSRTFMLTYGDGLSDVDLKQLLLHHLNSDSMVTLTAVHPETRFGVVDIGANDKILEFREKSTKDVGWINGGFMVADTSIFPLINGNVSFERSVLPILVERHQLSAFRHDGFWQCMDTMRDKKLLEEIWASGNVPWIK